MRQRKLRAPAAPQPQRVYRGHIIEHRPAGAIPPFWFRYVIRKPLVGITLHRARTLKDARAWIQEHS